MNSFFYQFILSKWPTMVRYAVAGLGALLVGKYLSKEQWDLIAPHADAILGGIVFIIVTMLGMKSRPSAKAFEAAKAIDHNVPIEDTVVVQTPRGQPDIIVTPNGNDQNLR